MLHGVDNMTFKDKIKNYWYYYRVHTIVGLLIAALIAVLVAQCASNEKYDYSVTLYMSKPMTETITDIIAEELSEFGSDLNGDGKISVQIIDCSYGENDNIRMNQVAKLQARLALPESMLFITDETCYKNLDEMGLFDSLDILPDKGGQAMNLNTTSVGQAIDQAVGQYMPSDFYISLRRIEGTAIEGKTGAEDYRQDAYTLLEKLSGEYAAE